MPPRLPRYMASHRLNLNLSHTLTANTDPTASSHIKCLPCIAFPSRADVSDAANARSPRLIFPCVSHNLPLSDGMGVPPRISRPGSMQPNRCAGA